MKHNKVFTFLSGITLGAVLMVSIAGFTPKIYSANKTIPALIDTGNKVFVDGVEKPTPAGYYLLNIDGRIYAPLRYVGEATGNTIDYIAANKYITIKTSAQSLKDEEDKIRAEYEKKLKDKDRELEELKEKYAQLEKDYKNDKAKYEHSPNVSQKEDGKSYSTLPVMRNFEKFKVKLSTILESTDEYEYATFFFKLKNDSGYNFEIKPETAKLTYRTKVGTTETLRETDTQPTKRDVSGVGVIKNDEEKSVGITMPKLPKECKYGTFTMEVVNSTENKKYKFEVDIDLDRNTMSKQDNDWDF